MSKNSPHKIICMIFLHNIYELLYYDSPHLNFKVKVRISLECEISVFHCSSVWGKVGPKQQPVAEVLSEWTREIALDP